MRVKQRPNSSTMTATKMRLVLSVSLLLILAAMSTGFYFSYLYLRDVSREVSTIQSQADSSDSELQALVQTRQLLSENSEAIEKARQIVAESQSYRYQDQVVTDISEYARRSGVGISSFTFQDTASAEPGGGAPAQTETEAPAGQSAAATNKTTTVSVQLAQEVDYVNLLHFIHLIEQNLTRMQITQLSLARGESPGTVNAQTLNIEVYLR